MEKSSSPLTRAIELAGSQLKLARKIGCTQQAISYWQTTGGRVPAEAAVKIEREFGVSRYELRPDIFGDEQVSV